MAKPNVYFILYGKLEFRNSKLAENPKFGQVMSLGWTVGEEVLYSEDDNVAVKRKENCIALNDALLL